MVRRRRPVADPPAGLPPVPGADTSSGETPFPIGSLSRRRHPRTGARAYPDHKLLVATGAVTVGTLALAGVVLLVLLVALER